MSYLKFQVSVCKSVEKDSFENGCSLTGGQDFGCIEKPEFKTIEDAFSFIQTFGTEPSIFDDRIEIQAMENDDGQTPSEKEMRQFKQGILDLWLARYSFYITRVERTDFGHSDLVAAFPNLEAECLS
jgi:hypothetical protein